MRKRVNINRIIINELIFSPVPYLAAAAVIILITSMVGAMQHTIVALGLLALCLQAVLIKYIYVKALLKNGEVVEAELLSCNTQSKGAMAYRYRWQNDIITEQQILPLSMREMNLKGHIHVIIDKRKPYRKLIAELYV